MYHSRARRVNRFLASPTVVEARRAANKASRRSRQWYLGFASTCSDWLDSLRERRDLSPTTSLHDLRVLFDKRLCHGACDTVGVPVPRSLGMINGWDELIACSQQSDTPRLFVKLANGSSASGVVALRIGRSSLEAITSVEMVRIAGELRLYNSLKSRRYTSRDDLRDLINALAAHRVHVEEWLPKATLQRRVLDLRVVVVAGRPKQMVVRTSRSPLTNLHLGNRRGNLAEVLARIPAPQLRHAGNVRAMLARLCRFPAPGARRPVHARLPAALPARSERFWRSVARCAARRLRYVSDRDRLLRPGGIARISAGKRLLGVELFRCDGTP